MMVLDNASPDGAGKKLQKMSMPENVQVVCSEKNIGFGQGHNRIFAELNRDGLSRYHVVINPDITLTATPSPASAPGWTPTRTLRW